MWGIGSRKKKNKSVKTSKKKKKSANPGVLAQVLSILWKILKVPAVFSAIGLIGFFFWFANSSDYTQLRIGITRALDNGQKSVGLVLENILLDGHTYTPKEKIIAAITGREDEGKIYIGYPIMDIDLWQIKANLEKLTWIKSASVTRQLPSTLSISVVERQPMALWQDNNKVNIIDINGKVINETNLERFSNLIILVGSKVPYHASHFLKFISGTPEVAKMVSSGVLVNGRRWNVNLKNGILVKLPEDNPEKAWEFLTKKQLENKILESNVKIIDLRIEKKMFVR